MPETTPKTAFSASFAAKAAAFALAVSASVFLAAYLAATVPDRLSGWRTALPTRGMDALQAETAALRSRYLHEAEIRPRLIRAGFLSPDELDTQRDSYAFGYDRDSAGSEALLRVLWSMRAFPELHETFLGMLLDQQTPAKERAKDFYTYAAFLAAQAEALARNSRADFSRRSIDPGRNRPDDADGWFAYFTNDPLSNLEPVNRRGYGGRAADPAAKATAAAEYDQKLALARRMLPLIFTSVRAEMDAQATLDAEETSRGKTPDAATKAWGGNRSDVEYLEEISEPVGRALLAMWEHRADAAFLAQARDLMMSGTGDFTQRFEAVPLMAKKPGLPIAEYIFWQKYEQDLASVTSCVGTSPRHYGYILGCMGELMTVTTNLMKAQGTFVLGGQTGPGVTLARTEAFAPTRKPAGNLYLLADMQLAMKDAPEYDFSRAVPIFRGMLYRHMVNQPQVLPLNPGNPKDAAILAWYQEKGWSEGRTLLFSAVGTPEEVARHWGTVHLVWWPDRKKKADEDPDLAYYHIVSGHFMAGMLPELKGEGVSRFLGPVTGLWFGRWNVDETGWVAEKYEARPEIAPRPMPARQEPLRSALYEWLTDARPNTGEKAAPPRPAGPPAILLGKEILQATGVSYKHNYKVTLARHLDETFHDAASSPRDVFDFANKTVTRLNNWGISHKDQVDPAAEYLWRFRDDPVVEKRVLEILSQEELRPYERLRKVRRALGLPETIKDRG